MIRTTLVLAVLLLAGCDSAAVNQTAHVPSYRHSFVNSSANSEYEPPNSLPR